MTDMQNPSLTLLLLVVAFFALAFILLAVYTYTRGKRMADRMDKLENIVKESNERRSEFEQPVMRMIELCKNILGNK